MRVLFRPLLQDVALQIRHGSCPPSGSGQSVFRRGGRRIPLGGRGFPHRGALLLDKQQDRRGSPGGGCVQGRQVTWRDFRLTLAVAPLAVMIGTALVDGRIARALGQSREFGGAFDSTVDFVVIYGIFTAFLAVGVLPWWKWAVIVLPALLMVWTQYVQVRQAGDVVFAPARAGKIVGQIQFVYLPFLLLRRFWLGAGWALTVDHVLFVLLALAIVFNTIDYARILRRLLARPGTPGATP